MTRIRGCCTRLRRKRDEIPKVTLRVTDILLFGGQILLFVIRERELVHEIRRKRYEIPQNHSQSHEYFTFPRTDFAFRDKKKRIGARDLQKRYEIPKVTLKVEDGLYFIHAGRNSIFMEGMQ